MTASLVLANGQIYTMDSSQPLASAVALRGERVLAVGNDSEMEALLATNGQKIDLGGMCVTPGLVDAHVHFQHFALSLKNVDLDGAVSLDGALQRLAAFVAQVSAGDSGWVRGRGWSQDNWPDRVFPTAADLDAVISDRPVYLAHKSGHAAWVNSVALRLCRINATTADPPGGQIQRDAGGSPTGILFEDAIGLITDHIPRPTPEGLVAAMRQAQHHCWEVGLTGLHDFDGRDCFVALQIMHERRELGLRVIKNVPVYRLEHALGVGLRSGFGDEWLRIGGVKIFADGALGSRTAAMIDPYESEPENRGIVVTDKEEMLEKARDAAQGGLSLTIHAIGDRANHDVLDVFDLLRKEERQNGGTRLRHRIEHVQVLHPDDLDRLAQLGITASMQPTHATSDMEMADRYWGSRARYSYAWRSMLDSGAELVFGSDAPVEKIDPLSGIHAAVTRRRANGHPEPGGWYPEQRLTMAETIHAFTTAAAITSGRERHLGSIASGKLADLTFYDLDIFTISPDELLDTRVTGTMVGGVFRYRTW
jgi:predicted amidohydrolase YtcJ